MKNMKLSIKIFVVKRFFDFFEINFSSEIGCNLRVLPLFADLSRLLFLLEVLNRVFDPIEEPFSTLLLFTLAIALEFRLKRGVPGKLFFSAVKRRLEEDVDETSQRIGYVVD